MEIAVLGTGAVGQAMSKKLSKLGHKIFMGTRNVAESLSKTETDQWGTPGIGSWITPSFYPPGIPKSPRLNSPTINC